MKTICFDLDGTLTDPKTGITRSIIHALTALGHDAPHQDQLEWCIGPPLPESFEKLLGNKHEVSSAISLYRERYSDVGALENILYEGTVPMLEAAKNAGFQIFLATSKAEIYARKILDHFQLTGFFDALYGAELNGVRSDKTDLLSYLIKEESLTPSKTIMVGDRRHDMIGAINNQIHPLGVTYGYGSRDELTAAGAATLCDTQQEVTAFLTLPQNTP